MILGAGRVAGNRLRGDYKKFFYIAVKKWEKGKSRETYFVKVQQFKESTIIETYTAASAKFLIIIRSKKSQPKKQKSLKKLLKNSYSS